MIDGVETGGRRGVGRRIDQPGVGITEVQTQFTKHQTPYFFLPTY